MIRAAHSDRRQYSAVQGLGHFGFCLVFTFRPLLGRKESRRLLKSRRLSVAGKKWRDFWPLFGNFDGCIKWRKFSRLFGKVAKILAKFQEKVANIFASFSGNFGGLGHS